MINKKRPIKCLSGALEFSLRLFEMYFPSAFNILNAFCEANRQHEIKYDMDAPLLSKRKT